MVSFVFFFLQLLLFCFAGISVYSFHQTLSCLTYSKRNFCGFDGINDYELVYSVLYAAFIFGSLK